MFPHEELHTLSQVSENFTLVLESNYFEPLWFNSQSQKRPEDQAKVSLCQTNFLWPVFSFLHREKLLIIIAGFFSTFFATLFIIGKLKLYNIYVNFTT